MKRITALGVDLSKNCFQLHGVNESGEVVLRRKCNRGQFERFLGTLDPSCRVFMEACAGAHHWGRWLKSKGHEVGLIAPQFVVPYRKSQKNDRNDAEAIVEAGLRPGMRFVPVKEQWQQDIQSLHRARQGILRNRTAQVNQIRGFLAEIGIVAPQGEAAFIKLMNGIFSGEGDRAASVEASLRELLEQLWIVWKQLSEHSERLSAKIDAIGSQREECRRLQEIPGVGPKIATALIASVGDLSSFSSGRALAAWVGLVPKQHSTGGRTVLMGITKRGDAHLRSLVVHGARSLVRVAKLRKDTQDPLERWIQRKLESKHANVVSVAVANRLMRIMWAVGRGTKGYRPELVAAA